MRFSVPRPRLIQLQFGFMAREVRAATDPWYATDAPDPDDDGPDLDDDRPDPDDAPDDDEVEEFPDIPDGDAPDGDDDGGDP